MKFWGTSKQSAYVGWFVTFIGGFALGIGVVLLLTMRMLVEIRETVGDPILYADLQLLSAVLVFLGLLGCIFGIVAIHHSQKSTTSVSVEKKFCQYCGTEIKSGAVFCEKCGKKIVGE